MRLRDFGFCCPLFFSSLQSQKENESEIGCWQLSVACWLLVVGHCFCASSVKNNLLRPQLQCCCWRKLAHLFIIVPWLFYHLPNASVFLRNVSMCFSPHFCKVKFFICLSFWPDNYVSFWSVCSLSLFLYRWQVASLQCFSSFFIFSLSYAISLAAFELWFIARIYQYLSPALLIFALFVAPINSWLGASAPKTVLHLTGNCAYT